MANIAQKRNKVLARHWSISYLRKRTFVKSNNKKVNLCHMDQYKNKDDYICSTVSEPSLGGGELRCCVHFSHRKAQQRTKLSIQLIQQYWTGSCKSYSRCNTSVTVLSALSTFHHRPPNLEQPGKKVVTRVKREESNFHSLQLCLSVCLSHTHTHTHAHILNNNTTAATFLYTQEWIKWNKSAGRCKYF